MGMVENHCLKIRKNDNASVFLPNFIHMSNTLQSNESSALPEKKLLY